MAPYSTRKRVSINENDRLEFKKGSPVLAIIGLSPSRATFVADVEPARLSQREAFIVMLKQTFPLDLGELERMSRPVGASGRLVPRLPAYRLSMPHDHELLPLARQEILETVL